MKSQCELAWTAGHDNNNNNLGYFPYLVFVEYVICTICKFISIILFSNLLYCCFFNKKKLCVNGISSTMSFYMLVEATTTFFGVWYHVYTTVMWRPHMENPYEPYMLFWTGLWHGSYYASTPLPIFFLTLDRCMIIKCHFSKRSRTILLVVDVVVVLAVYLGITTSILSELPLDLSRVCHCKIATCVLLKHGTIFLQLCRVGTGVINFFGGLTFLWLLKGNFDLPQVKNRAIKFTILSGMFLNILPNFVGILFKLTTNLNSQDFLGEYGSMLCAIDGCCCSIYYSMVFLETSMQQHAVSTVQTLYSNNNIGVYR